MSVPRVIPVEWLPPGRRVWRIVLHWSAGNNKPSAYDRLHYNCLIDGEGRAVKGVPLGLPCYHTRNLNTSSYGLSIAGMRLAREGGPYGDQPITSLQYERAAQAAAEVIAAYNLALNERTCLSHEEVTYVYGPLNGKTPPGPERLRQRNRWDVSELPFERAEGIVRSKREVWELFRRKVAWYLNEYHGR